MHPGWEERKKTAATPVWESRSAANDALLPVQRLFGVQLAVCSGARIHACGW